MNLNISFSIHCQVPILFDAAHVFEKYKNSFGQNRKQISMDEDKLLLFIHRSKLYANLNAIWRRRRRRNSRRMSSKTKLRLVSCVGGMSEAVRCWSEEMFWRQKQMDKSHLDLISNCLSSPSLLTGTIRPHNEEDNNVKYSKGDPDAIENNRLPHHEKISWNYRFMGCRMMTTLNKRGAYSSFTKDEKNNLEPPFSPLLLPHQKKNFHQRWKNYLEPTFSPHLLPPQKKVSPKMKN